MKRKNKGFTLVELIVAIAILGIITAIALPGIIKLQQNNKTKKFETYEDSVLSSAKLYVDSYEEDLFSTKSEDYGLTQCYAIKYEDLKKRGLLKDTLEKGITCKGLVEDVYAAYVTKQNGKYTYAVGIKCNDSKGEVFRSGDLGSFSQCDISTGKLKTTQIAWGDEFGKCTKNPTATFTLWDPTKEVEKVEYSFSKSKINDDTDAKKLTYTQESNFKADTEIQTFNIEVSGYETDKYEDYYLVIKLTKKDRISYYYDSTKPLQLDLAGPRIDVISKIWEPGQTAPTDKQITNLANYSAASWTNKNVIVVAKASDSCLGTTTEIIGGNYINKTEEGNHTVTFTAKDNLGNETTKSLEVNIDKTPPTINITAYKRTVRSDGGGTFTGESVGNINLTGTTGQAKTEGNLKDYTINHNGWLNKESYPEGIFYKVDVSDNLALNDSKWSYNSPNLKATSSNLNTVLDTRTNTLSGTSITPNSENFDFNHQGYKKAWYTVTDKAGNEAKVNIEAKLDIDPPNITSLNNPSNGNWTNQNIQLTVNATDNISEINNYSYAYPNSQPNHTLYDLTSCKANNSCSYNTNLTTFTTTPYSAERNEETEIRVCDTAGNCSTKRTNIRIDKTAPTLTITAYKRTSSGGAETTSLSSATANNSTKTVTLNTNSFPNAQGTDKWLNSSYYKDGVYYKVSASDTSELKAGKWEWNNTWKTKAAADVNTKADSRNDTFSGTSDTSKYFTLTGQGYRKGWYTLTDQAGNSVTVNIVAPIDLGEPGSPTLEMTRSQDTTKADGAQAIIYSNGTWINKNVFIGDFRYTASSTIGKRTPQSTDKLSGINRYEISSDNSNWETYKYDTSKELYRVQTEGTHHRYLRAIDNAGNISEVTTKTIKIDKTPPTISVSAKKGTYSGTSKTCTSTSTNYVTDTWKNYDCVNMSLNATDSGSDIDYVKRERSDDTNKTANISKNTVTFQRAQDNILWTYTAYDKAGNNAKTTFRVKLDREDPDCELKVTNGTKGKNDWYTSNVTVGFKSKSDSRSDIDTYDLTTTSSAPTNYTKGTSQTLNTDTTGQTYYGHVKDKAGNTKKCSITVKRDTEAPTFQLIEYRSSIENSIFAQCIQVNSDISLTRTKFSDTNSNCKNINNSTSTYTYWGYAATYRYKYPNSTNSNWGSAGAHLGFMGAAGSSSPVCVEVRVTDAAGNRGSSLFKIVQNSGTHRSTATKVTSCP